MSGACPLLRLTRSKDLVQRLDCIQLHLMDSKSRLAVEALLQPIAALPQSHRCSPRPQLRQDPLQILNCNMVNQLVAIKNLDLEELASPTTTDLRLPKQLRKNKRFSRKRMRTCVAVLTVDILSSSTCLITKATSQTLQATAIATRRALTKFPVTSKAWLTTDSILEI